MSKAQKEQMIQKKKKRNSESKKIKWPPGSFENKAKKLNQ